METNYHKNAITAGILFILGFAGAFSATILVPLLESEDLIGAFAGNINGVRMAALGLIIMGLACTGVAIALYPVLKEKHKAMALGAVIFRAIEGVLAVLGGIMFLLMSNIAQQADGLPMWTSFIKITIDLNNDIVIGGTIAWGIGAILYYLIMFLRKIVPSWLSVWGLVSIILCLVATLLGYFNLIDSNGSFHTILSIPIALQEVVLAGWLIIKGFRNQSNKAVQ